MSGINHTPGPWRQGTTASFGPCTYLRRTVDRTVMTYAPRWRLASWHPDSYSVEAEGEPGRVEIDDGDFDWMGTGDININLWMDACDDLADAGIVPPPDADEDWCYPDGARQHLPWRGWDAAPWHVRAAILARRVEELEARAAAAPDLLRACLLGAAYYLVQNLPDVPAKERWNAEERFQEAYIAALEKVGIDATHLCVAEIFDLLYPELETKQQGADQ